MSAAAGVGADEVTYQLFIEVAAQIRIVVGALGWCEFPAGCYVYTGSAKRNIDARIRRHQSREKRLHWHIDYLLNAPEARIVDVQKSRQPECAVNKATRGQIIVPGFGASDCRASCGSHLKYQGVS